MLMLPGIMGRNRSQAVTPPLPSASKPKAEPVRTLLTSPVDSLEVASPSCRSSLESQSFSSSRGVGSSMGLGSESVSLQVCRNDFEVVELLGVGAFGEVKLVKCKKDAQLYAMKVVEKMLIHERRQLQDLQAAERVQAERDIGVAARHWQCPFIISLNATFQTNEKLYYIFEHCPGGDLRNLLDVQLEGRFQEEAACFYLSEVVLALAHLHEHDTIHRDVKLENVLLDADGHVRLADFGCAKSCSEGGRGSGFAGDADILMPPEFARGEDCGKEFDCWQIGVLAFVMLSGCWPRYMNAQEWQTALPQQVSVAAGAFCRELMREARTERLGFPKGASLLFSHAFFAEIDWNDVRHKAIVPPLHVNSRRGLPLRDTLKTSGVRDLFKFPNFSFTRKSVFGNLRRSNSTRKWRSHSSRRTASAA